MPETIQDGTTLYYETLGSGETVAFVGDAGVGAWQWAWQTDALAGAYETLVFDHRGTGRSDAPPGPYDVATLAADFEAVLAAAGVGSAHVVGCGLGALVALEHARESGRPETLTLLGACPDPADREVDPLALAADRDDEAALRETTERAFSAEFVERAPEAVADVVEWRGEEDADRAGWTAQAAAVTDYAGEALYEVTTDAVVLHGTDDEIWPAAGGEALAEALPKGSFEAVAGAGHFVGIEASVAVNDLLADRIDAAFED